MTTFKEAFGGPRKSIYLNNASTTMVRPDVIATIEPYLRLFYGNASDKNTLGEISMRAVIDARQKIAAAINCSPHDIFFTSGGSESNNWVIKGLVNKFHFHHLHIISDNIEHHSITEALKSRWNAHEDIEYVLVPVEESGVVDAGKVSDAIGQYTSLVSIMMVNNELGTIQPIKEIAAKCQEKGAMFHTDATQAFGHMKIDVEEMGIDLLTASAHKIQGPKGIGFLYISKRVRNRFEPLISGGQQEFGMRAGTENVPAIVGFGRAVEIAMANMDKNEAHEKELQKLLLSEIKQLDGVHINGKIEYIDPRHLNIRVDGCRGEELQALLNEQKIYISTGSACNSHSGQPSHVLKAIGLTDDEANSSIRISIGAYNTREEIETFIACLKQDIDILRSR